VEDGTLVAVEPDPGHPTGKSICVKGRAAPELVYSPDRLLHPLRRTRPRDDPDPGWVRIGWDEALDWTAQQMRRAADRHGPESVAFAVTTPAGTSMSDGLEGEAHIQLRAPVVPPRGEARSDVRIVCELAQRLGLGAQFFGGDEEAGHRWVLEPSGVTLEQLRARPEGVRVPLEPRFRRYAAPTPDGLTGFATPSRRVELYAQRFLEHGQSPLPEYVPPAVGAVARPDLAARYPLVLTSAKWVQFCHSQHRALPTLRAQIPDPLVEIHPAAAAARDVGEGDWVVIQTPRGTMRARARLNATLAPDVVCAQFGWWQACEALGRPGYAIEGPASANYNGAIGTEAGDPISGTIPLRSYVCELRRSDAAEPEPAAIVADRAER
jgi:anaerobic selenocysteine-containing dehydrogenase